ncbi:MAG: hypothetical protein EHM70_15065, partial [Chloroflexota bacterium]
MERPKRHEPDSAMTTAPFQLTRRNVLNNIATLFSGSAAAQGMMVITMLLMARQLGTDRYGQYASCLTLCVLTSTLFNLGMDNWLLPEGSRRASQLGELVGSTLVIKLAAGVCWLALVVMIPPLIRPLTYPRDLLLATGLAVWFDGLFATMLTAFKARLRNWATSLLEAGSDLVWLLSVLYLYFSGNERALTYAQARAAILLLTLVISVVLVMRLSSLRSRLTTVRQALRASPPFAVSEFLALAAMRVDVVIVSFTLGSAAAGLYSPAVGIVNGLFLVPTAVYMVMVPVLSNLYAA